MDNLPSGPQRPPSSGQKPPPPSSPPHNSAPFNYKNISPQPFTSSSNPSPPGATMKDTRSPPSNQTKNDLDVAPTGLDGHPTGVPTILMRKLPSSMSHDALRSMLLFAEECIEARFVPSDSSEDQKFQSAIAQFRTMDSAHEARDRLNGKLNATKNATMVVEIVGSRPEMLTERRHTTSEGQSYRQLSTSASSGGSTNGNGARQSSRFNTTFQSLDKMSPTRVPRHMSHGEFTGGDLNAHKQSFIPQSPIGTSFGESLRVSGKSVINEDAVDDETGDLLKDPLAYAKSDQSVTGHPVDQQVPVSRLAGLSLSTSNTQDGTSMMSPPGTGYGPNRSIPQPLHSPISEMSPTGMGNGMAPLSPTSTFPLSPKFQRHQYPPANPADQNPPCNTLYVGNLPVDTSEDELKAVFSKQRGYKRLCFRTKHNGPMCFVEFEDVSFATKALNELYGHPLHNSVKGGIRLSFSKNPLGVRTGQANAMGPQSPLGSPNNPAAFGNGMGAPPGFSTASGPPPGLSMPPGLSPPMSAGGLSSNASGNSQGFFAPNSPPLSSSSLQNASRSQAPVGSFMAAGTGGGYNNLGSNGFPDFMMGR